MIVKHVKPNASLLSTVVYSFNMYDFVLTAVLLKFIWMRAVFNKLVRALFPRVAAISPAVAHCKISRTMMMIMMIIMMMTMMMMIIREITWNTWHPVASDRG